MCPICYYHEITGLIQPKLSMFSTCNHWFQAPSPPVNSSYHPQTPTNMHSIDAKPAFQSHAYSRG